MSAPGQQLKMPGCKAPRISAKSDYSFRAEFLPTFYRRFNSTGDSFNLLIVEFQHFPASPLSWSAVSCPVNRPCAVFTSFPTVIPFPLLMDALMPRAGCCLRRRRRTWFYNRSRRSVAVTLSSPHFALLYGHTNVSASGGPRAFCPAPPSLISLGRKTR